MTWTVGSVKFAGIIVAFRTLTLDAVSTYQSNGTMSSSNCFLNVILRFKFTMKHPPKSEVKKLNRNFFSIFLPTIITLFKLSYSDYTWQCILATIVRIGIDISIDFVTWHMYDITADFAVALSTYDYVLFYAALMSGIKCAALLAFLGTLSNLISSICAIVYRRNAVEQAHKKYFRHATYYRLNCIDNMNVDNPDQRITADIAGCSEMCVNGLTPMFTKVCVKLGIRTVHRNPFGRKPFDRNRFTEKTFHRKDNSPKNRFTEKAFGRNPSHRNGQLAETDN
uniref:ABC transmembrane type-1 domain-containing protein n=1 Tax=Panagrellus redivivus TaxID=6233 RepID=A0A7E4UTN9_PANRE